MSSPVSHPSTTQTFTADHAPKTHKTGKNAIEAELKAGKVVSACAFLQALLESKPNSDDYRYGGFTRDTNNLLRTKIACKLDMVLMPDDKALSRTHYLFTTRQNYPKHVERAQAEREQDRTA